MIPLKEKSTQAFSSVNNTGTLGGKAVENSQQLHPKGFVSKKDILAGRVALSRKQNLLLFAVFGLFHFRCPVPVISTTQMCEVEEEEKKKNS